LQGKVFFWIYISLAIIIYWHTCMQKLFSPTENEQSVWLKKDYKEGSLIWTTIKSSLQHAQTIFTKAQLSQLAQSEWVFRKQITPLSLSQMIVLEKKLNQEDICPLTKLWLLTARWNVVTQWWQSMITQIYLVISFLWPYSCEHA